MVLQDPKITDPVFRNKNQGHKLTGRLSSAANPKKSEEKNPKKSEKIRKKIRPHLYWKRISCPKSTPDSPIKRIDPNPLSICIYLIIEKSNWKNQV